MIWATKIIVNFTSNETEVYSSIEYSDGAVLYELTC
jgi:hypothetical protein